MFYCFFKNENINGGVIMFCSKCGEKLDENSKFCIKCGTAVNTAQGIVNQAMANMRASYQEPPKTVELPKKKNTERNVIIAVSGAVLFLVVVLIVGISSNSPKQPVQQPQQQSQQQNADSDAFFLSGKAAFDSGEYNRAINDYTEGIRLNPNDAEAYAYRGTAYSYLGDSDSAIDDFTQAIRLQPGYTFAYVYRSTLYRSKNNFKQARADINRALQFDPNNEYVKKLDTELREMGY
jgi:tetratricopeptide (TPR) repeat protein